jgi:selenocysteine-specific elongation factor
MGTAGHVDHGKTSLIKALTGIDGDTHKEEKKRGITINLGFSHLDLDDKISLGIVDVPGHKDFVKTMIAGAHGIDFVLLVIAADSGIMPQTREHFNIIKMLGIKHGLIALNKSDLVDDETIELAKLEIMEFVDNSTLEHAPIVPVSATTGFGLEALKSVIKRVAEKVDTKTTTNQFRMYVDRIFNVKGIGIVVTGSVLGGEASIGEELFLLPGSHNKLKIKGLERHGRQVEKIENYITDIVFATRFPADYKLKKFVGMINYGGSPRASINLALASKAYAFIKRRGYVIPEDIRAVAHDVLRHRIGLSYEAEAENITTEDVINEILNTVEVP